MYQNYYQCVYFLLIIFTYSQAYTMSYRAPYSEHTTPLYNEYDIEVFRKYGENRRKQLREAPGNANKFLKVKSTNTWILSPSYAYENANTDQYLKGRSYAINGYMTQEEPLTVEGKDMPFQYTAADYPGFNPQIIFDERFSRGERERIKKALILIKIILHTDLFKRTLRNSTLRYYSTFYGSENEELYEEYIIDGLTKDKVPFDVNDFINNFLQYRGLVYIVRSDETNTHFAAAGPVGGNLELSSLITNVNKTENENTKIRKFDENDPRNTRGIIYLYYGGKSSHYGHLQLPLIIIHELTHIIGYTHISRILDYIKELDGGNGRSDVAQSINFNFIPKLFKVLDYPYVPNYCYSGTGEKWNRC